VIDSNGRGGGIRTPDPLLPKQMRYQAALRPDSLSIVSQANSARRQPTHIAAYRGCVSHSITNAITRIGVRNIASRTAPMSHRNTQSRHAWRRGSFKCRESSA
jgi:hypothetical protein